MKLTQSKEHICKYWDTFPRHHSRHCNYCRKWQYNYTGEWKDKISFEEFIDLWTGGMGGGTDYESFIKIEIAFPFEARSYESWDTMYSITFLKGKYEGQTFQWFENWNEADAAMEKAGLEHFWEWQRKNKEQPVDKSD